MANAGQHFLRLLWGDDVPGQLQVWTLADKRSEYWPHWRGIDRDGQRDVFCAMGTTARRLGARQRATTQQVCAIAGCWLDLDVKDGAASNQAAALQLAQRFTEPTVVVDSGHGIHAYYLFDGGPWIFRSIGERDEAASLVRRFVTLHQRAATWHVDSVGDLARLMRLPGTLNAKNPGRAVLVHVLPDDGPRHTRADLLAAVADVDDTPPGAGDATLFDIGAALTGDASALDAKLDALLANSPEFADAWEHRPAPDRRDLSPSAWDLCLCSLAAGAMTDAELAALVAMHRRRWSWDTGKAQRADYLARTITRARARAARDQATTRLDQTTTRRAA